MADNETNNGINPYQMEICYTTEEYVEAVQQRIAEAKAAQAYWEEVLEEFVNLQGLT